jgi:small-conductance mechanosensitive channel
VEEASSNFIDIAISIAAKLPGAIISFILGYLAIKITMFFAKKSIKIFRTSAAVRTILIKIIEGFLWFFLIIFILNYLGLGGLVVAITGASVLVGFILNNGLSQSISDIFSGIELSREKDFKVGTKISTNEDKIVGEVVGMNLRKVKIIDDQGKLHVVPNSIFDKNEWVVLKRKDESHKSKK